LETTLCVSLDSHEQNLRLHLPMIQSYGVRSLWKDANSTVYVILSSSFIKQGKNDIINANSVSQNASMQP